MLIIDVYRAIINFPFSWNIYLAIRQWMTYEYVQLNTRVGRMETIYTYQLDDIRTLQALWTTMYWFRRELIERNRQAFLTRGQVMRFHHWTL